MRRSLVLAVALVAGLVPAGRAGAAQPVTTLLVTTAGDGVALPAGARPLADRVFSVEAHGPVAAAVAELRAVPGVLAVEPDAAMEPYRVPDDERYEDQWSHALTGIEAAWDTTIGAGATVALLDSGINAEHPDLVGNVTTQVDVSTGTPRTVAAGSNNDACALGHGTEVAGVLGAVGHNGRAVAGASWAAEIVDVAVVGTASSCRMSDRTLVAGLAYAASNAAVDVVNVSFGRMAGQCPTAVQAAIDQVRAAGKVVVAAAGNVPTTAKGVGAVPASCNGVLSVAAADADGRAAEYSAANRWVDLLAPGGERAQGVVTTSADLSTTQSYGSSLAAGYVSGTAALVAAVRPTASPAEIEALLLGTASDVAPTGRDDATGWGLVRPAAAVTAAQGTVPAAKPATTFPVADFGMARIAPGRSNPIDQAVVLSSLVFDDDAARHVVLARADDYADALSGSSLAGAMGPVLFTNRTGAIPQHVRDELRRVLPNGGRVYLLGGSAALPASAEEQIRGLGLTPQRIAGVSREATAGLVAAEGLRRRAALGLSAPDVAVLATSRNWPDAAISASLGAVTGAPILLTPPGALDAAAADALFDMRPRVLYVVGGTSAISATTADSARRAGSVDPNDVIRLAGDTRVTTAVRVAAETESLIRGLTGAAPTTAVAVNVRRPEGFAYVLASTSVVASQPGVFIPVEGLGGGQLPEPVVSYACRLGARPIVTASTDVISTATADRLPRLFDGSDAACR